MENELLNGVVTLMLSINSTGLFILLGDMFRGDIVYGSIGKPINEVSICLRSLVYCVLDGKLFDILLFNGR